MDMPTIADVVLIVALSIAALMVAYIIFQLLLIRHIYKDIKKRYGL